MRPHLPDPLVPRAVDVKWVLSARCTCVRFGRFIFLSSACCSPMASLQHLWSKSSLSLPKQDRAAPAATVYLPLRLLHPQLSLWGPGHGYAQRSPPKAPLENPRWVLGMGTAKPSFWSLPGLSLLPPHPCPWGGWGATPAELFCSRTARFDLSFLFTTASTSYHQGVPRNDHLPHNQNPFCSLPPLPSLSSPPAALPASP